MLFNSFGFLIFFVVVTVLYYVTSAAWRWLLLLLASCYFYMAFIPAYILVLLTVVTIDYIAGLSIEISTGRKRKIFLLASITANLGVLFIFKYFNFFVENINDLLLLLDIHAKSFPFWQIALPIGLSFHTFQAMSYTIEVYKGKQSAERHFGIYALYVMFYPQLVAGPIERPQQLLHQFHESKPVSYEGIATGLKSMLLGFFMKVVVADRLAIYVDYVFAHPAIHSRLAVIIAAVFCSFQIYCDFAGYSLIAIGAAKVMGFNLSVNFRQPFLATSMTDYWKRWHITLSSWFRDYIYIPIGGNRVTYLRHIFNILFVFILSGLWHGASWTFITWGFLHGLYLVAEKIFGKKARATYTLPRRIASSAYIIILVSFSRIFYRSQSVQEAFNTIKRLFQPSTPWFLATEFQERALLVYSFTGFGLVMLADIQKEFYNRSPFFLDSGKTIVRMGACIGLVILILILGVFDGGQFVYFQF